MDAFIWWLWLLARVIILLVTVRLSFWVLFWVVEKVYSVSVSVRGYRFLNADEIVVKNKDIELLIENPSLQLRWFSKSCRRFFRLRLHNIQLQCVRVPPERRGGGGGAISTSQNRADSIHSHKIGEANAKPSRKRRVLNFLLRLLFRLLEVSVGQLDIMVHDVFSGNLGFLDVIHVAEGVQLLAKPLPDSKLAVSFEVDKLSWQTCVCVSPDPYVAINDDFLPVLDTTASCRGLLFLSPLSLSTRIVDSVQCNVSSLSLQLQSEPLTYLAKRLNHLLAHRKSTNVFLPSPSTGVGRSEIRIPSQVPRRTEVTLDKVYFEYYTGDGHRVLTSEVSSLSLDLCVISFGIKNKQDTEEYGSLSASAKDFLLKPRMSHETVRIKHVRLVSKLTVSSLDSCLSLSTGKGILKEADLHYWVTHFYQLFRSLRKTLAFSSSVSSRSLPLLYRFMNIPVAMVTTIEASDCLCSIQLDRSTNHSERPLFIVVMARVVMRAQVEEMKQSTIEEGERGERPVSLLLRLDDTYVHVPNDNSSRKDNRSLLPSSCQHHWGRAAAAGSLAVRADTVLTPISGGHLSQKVTLGRVSVNGEGNSVVLEWSQPAAVTLLQTFTQLESRYQVLSTWMPAKQSGMSAGKEDSNVTQTDSLSSNLGEADSQTSLDLDFLIAGTPVQISLVVKGLNVFVYGDSPVPVVLLLRVDSASLSTPGLVQLLLYHVAMNELAYSLYPCEAFPCQPVASLPSGLLDIAELQMEYATVGREFNVGINKGTVNWTTCTHLTITHIIDGLWPTKSTGISKSGQTVSLQPPKESESSEIKGEGKEECVKIGDSIADVMLRVPVQVGVKMEEGVVNLNLDQHGAKVSLMVETGHCYLKEGMLIVDTYELGVEFDGQRIVNVFGFIGNFPNDEGEIEGERERMTGLEVKKNPKLAVCASKVFIDFPNEYKFAATFENLMCVRKFLQGFHSSRQKEEDSYKQNFPNRKKYLVPDVLVEVDEFLFQLDDNPFEIKLRGNHVLMQDEQDERQCRQQALEERLMKTKQEQGRSRVSDKKVHALYEKLSIQNDSIYCQRARELYNYEAEPPRSQLFTVSLHQFKLLIMADPSMMGRDNLVRHINEIDSTSPPLSTGYQFSTLWGIYLSGGMERLEVQLRDYPWKLMEGENIGLSGRLLFAEQEAQEREQYTVTVNVGAPWKNGTVIRKLPPLKYYHDFEINAESIEWAWGPCCDPCFSQINYAFNFITKPAIDPSPPLPFWDKFRLLVHGNFHLNTTVMMAKLLASRDPYNEAEYLEVRLLDLDAHLQDNVSLDLVGGAHAFVHTASRYDDCQLVQLPLSHLTVSLEWLCRSTPQCHHDVIRCVPGKLPELPEGQQHDSYALFRSHNLNLTLNLKVEEREDLQDPEIHLYASTLRWIQQYVSLLREAVSRPIRRGRVFVNVRPKKLRLTRHIKTFCLSASFPKSTLQYWSSVYQQRGLEFHVDGASFDMKYILKLVPYDDGLVRRPRTDWLVASLQGEVLDILAYTCTKSKEEELDMDSSESDQYIIRNPYAEDPATVPHNVIVKHKLVSISKLTYWQNIPDQESSQEFTHQLKTTNTHILWNSSNKEVIDRLLNAYRLFQRLKKDLSTEALQSIITKLDTPTHKLGNQLQAGGESTSEEEKTRVRKRHMRRLSSSGCVMLDKLLADICNTLVVSSVEQKEPSDPRLMGIVSANQDDMKQLNWFIELTNTQLALQGVEKRGYVVASSYIAQVFGREHAPRWREGDLVSKKSWVAKVQDLQFLCTTELSPENRDKVPWLPLSVIQPAGMKELDQLKQDNDEELSVSSLLSQLGPDISHPLGAKGYMSTRPPGEAVGGMVKCVPELGTVVEDPCGMPHTPQPLTPQLSSPHRTGYQLQRIASRGHCQVFYVTYGGEISSSDYPPSELLSKSKEGSPLGFSESNDAVDTLTFRFPMAEVSTTSSQYALIVDILNNLLLHKEPRKKEATEQHARMKFLLQLSNVPDARKPVLAKQNKIRQMMRKVHELETELYREQKQGTDNSLQRRSGLERELARTKEDLSVLSVELRAMIRAFKEQQLHMTTPRSDSDESLPPEPVRRIEVWLDDSQWNIMQDDGQLQVSEIRLTNFSYNRISFSDDSGDHRFELGSFKVLNCMPNTQEFFQEVLSPYDPQSRRLRVDKNVSMRIYCRDQAPVAGISVTEHLEVNVVPLAVRLTERFYQTMQDFFLPRQEGDSRDFTSDPDHSHIMGVQPTFASTTDNIDGAAMSRGHYLRRSVVSVSSSIHSTSITTTAVTSGTQPSPPESPISKDVVRNKTRRTASVGGRIDDVEKMKARASKMKAFIYVKIPQLTLCITYKGEGISVKEMHDQLVTVQTLEYHNRNCTWRELLLEVKKDYKNAIISQTIKSAIGIRESEERAGLASPKLVRHTSDILMGGIKAGKATSKKVLTRLNKGSVEEENGHEAAASPPTAAAYHPPLADVNSRKRPKLFSK